MNNRIDALTATRGFAALMVVIFHFGCNVFPFSYCDRFFSGGNFAVSYFFVLSGFVMYMAYHSKEVDYGIYLRRRVARIVPLYLFAILLMILPQVYNYLAYGTGLEENFLSKLLLNITLMQAYVPGYALTLNIPGWSLSVEMFFYLLFPLLLLLQKKNEKRFVWITAIVFFLSQFVHLFLIKLFSQPTAQQHDLIYYNPIMHINQFMIGICGGFFLAVIRRKGIRLSALIFLVAIIMLISFLPRSISIHNGLLAPVFLLLILAVAVNPSKALESRPLIFLGEISYGIYILQLPVNQFATMLNTQYLHLGDVSFFYFYLVLLLLVCTLCYYVIEQPFATLINRRKKVHV